MTARDQRSGKQIKFSPQPAASFGALGQLESSLKEPERTPRRHFHGAAILIVIKVCCSFDSVNQERVGAKSFLAPRCVLEFFVARRPRFNLATSSGLEDTCWT